MDRQLQPTKSTYDPAKYVRGYAVMHGVNTSQLPQIQNIEKKAEKYSYEDYLKKKGGSGNGNNQMMSKDQYSEEYKRQGTAMNMGMGSPDNSSHSFDQFRNNRQMMSQSTYSEFGRMDNNYSDTPKDNPLNFNPTEKKSEFSLLTSQQEAQAEAFNPYASLTLGEFKGGQMGGNTNMGGNMGNMGNNMNNNMSQMGGNMGNMGNNMNNKSQMGGNMGNMGNNMSQMGNNMSNNMGNNMSQMNNNNMGNNMSQMNNNNMGSSQMNRSQFPTQSNQPVMGNTSQMSFPSNSQLNFPSNSQMNFNNNSMAQSQFPSNNNMNNMNNNSSAFPKHPGNTPK